MIIGGNNFDAIVVTNIFGEVVALITDEVSATFGSYKVFLGNGDQFAFQEVDMEGIRTLMLNLEEVIEDVRENRDTPDNL